MKNTFTMKSTFLSFGLSFILIFSLSSCGKSEAERMAIKWCECNQTMGELYKQLDETKEPEKLTSIVSNIMVESNNVTVCMGGEEKLKEINAKLTGSDKADFQKQYNDTRNSMCPEMVKLLSKKTVDHKPEPEPEPEVIDSTTTPTDSTKVAEEIEEDED
jgi:hypothetical protein